MRTDELTRVLPHRDPMLLVDQVVEFVPGTSLVALKAVDCADYPAVLVLESWCQAAAVLICADARTGSLPLFGGVTGARFTTPVRPGDVLAHHVTLTRRFADSAVFEGESRVGADVVLAVDRVVVALRAATEEVFG